MMKITSILMAAVGALAFPVDDLSSSAMPHMFNLFKKTFDKEYSTVEEEAKRFENFVASVRRVSASSNKAQGITQFSDMSKSEFAKLYLTGRKSNLASQELEAKSPWDGSCTACTRFPEQRSFNGTDLDWVAKGAVSLVKNQGQCGSCWSFGATGDIEGVHFMGGNDMLTLSEQSIVSCDTKIDQGCNGGLQENAFAWIIKKGGIVSEKQYRYTSGMGKTGKCLSKKVHAPWAATISSWSQVSASAAGEATLEQALIKSGPVTIGIDAGPMQDYFGGIDDPSECRHTQKSDLDHAVLMVGFGEEDGQKYWKIKNSWGPSWGEDGYYRIVRGQNKCGIAFDAVHAAL